MVPTTLINRIEENPFLMELSSLFNDNQFSFYLVGGAVRDFILDIDTKDFDFTTNATPEDSISLLNSNGCLLYTSPSPRDDPLSRMPSSA